MSTQSLATKIQLMTNQINEIRLARGPIYLSRYQTLTNKVMIPPTTDFWWRSSDYKVPAYIRFSADLSWTPADIPFIDQIFDNPDIKKQICYTPYAETTTYLWYHEKSLYAKKNHQLIKIAKPVTQFELKAKNLITATIKIKSRDIRSVEHLKNRSSIIGVFSPQEWKGMGKWRAKKPVYILHIFNTQAVIGRYHGYISNDGKVSLMLNRFEHPHLPKHHIEHSMNIKDIVSPLMHKNYPALHIWKMKQDETITFKVDFVKHIE